MSKREIVIDGVKYRKVDEEKPKYREVRRGAKAGERIRIIAARETFGAYENGDEFIVDGVSRFESGVYVEEVETPGNDSGYIIDREYVVLEPIEDEQRLTVGDYVKVVNSSCTHNFELGEVGKVMVEDMSHRPYRVESVCGKRAHWLTGAEVELVTKEDFDRAVDEYKRKQFKKGDKVRLVSGGGNYPLKRFDKGDLCTVSDNDYPHETGPYGKLIEIAKCGAGVAYASPEKLEPVSEEEYDEYVREKKERRKWAELGRGVGEIREGDIVRVVDGCGGEDDGTIGTAMYDGTVGCMGIHGGESPRFRGIVELLSPVENRFDNDKE